MRGKKGTSEPHKKSEPFHSIEKGENVRRN